jgi:mRNA interferase YafQ
LPEFTYTSQFEENLKLLKSRNKDLNTLFSIIKLLIWEEPLDDICEEHKLQGGLEDFWEIHIEDDWILLYQQGEYTISFVYTGTHSDFFK